MSTEEKKANHQVNVVQINEVLPHSNADKLEIIVIGGYQVVVRKGDFLPGTLGVYIQPDSVVPQTEPFKFIWENYIGLDGTVPEKKRRIAVRKFRGEWSEGLLLPLTDFFPGHGLGTADYYAMYPEGMDVSDILGITHYDPDKGKEAAGETTHAPRQRQQKRPRTLKGWLRRLLRWLPYFAKGERKIDVAFEAPVYDVEAWKHFKKVLEPGESIRITEKIHGSNARYVYLDGTMYAGSRHLWKSPKSKCIWRKALDMNPWIEMICKANPGYIFYGEVTPTQPGFEYGNQPGNARFFLFDVRTPDGKWLAREDYLSTLEMFGDLDYAYISAPSLGIVAYDPETVKAYVDGPSTVPGANHIREGIVIRPLRERRVPGLGRVQLKLVSNAFLEKDSK